MTNTQIQGWLNNGLSVTFNVDFNDATPEDSMQYLTTYSNRLIAAGLLTKQPQNEGEKQDMVGYVVRREKISKQDGSIVPMIDLYFNHDAIQYKFISIYLNSDQQIADFEAAIGRALDSLPLYIGDNHIERHKNPRTDEYVIQVKPVGIVYKPNPRYNTDEPDIKKRKPRWLFVRWNGVSSRYVPNRAENAANGHSDANPGQSSERLYDPAIVVNSVIDLFADEAETRATLRQMAVDGWIRNDMNTEDVIATVKQQYQF